MLPKPARTVPAPSSGAPAQGSALAERILLRSLDHVVEQSRLGLVTAVVITSTLGTLFVPTAGWRPYLLWFAVAAGGFILRQLWFEHMRRLPGQRVQHHLTRATVSSAFTGWVVILSLPLFGPGLQQDQFILLVGLFLAWITAGVSLLAVQPRVYLGYLVACLGTVMLALWQRFGLVELNVLSLAVPLGGLMMYRLALGIQRLISEAVSEGMHNETLAARLSVALADARTAFETRSRFLASASHDLKQPVHALSLLVNVLQRTRNEARRQQVIGEIDHASRSIDSMFTSLMDMARIDAGSLAAHMTDVPLLPLLKSVLAGYPDQCAQKGLKFALHAPESTVVRADPLLLQRVLANLLDNALKFTLEGQIEVEVTQSGETVRLVVSDTGMGIPADEQGSLFEPFTRGTQAQHMGIAGLGLGLAVVHHMTRLMGTRLHLCSSEGSGTTFELNLERGVLREPVNLQERTSVALGGKLIWLVEDDKIAREATQHWLQECGASVEAMASASAAQAQGLGQGRPDLLIADHNLGPEQMTGVELVVWAQTQFSGLPAIIMTGESSVALQQARATLLRKPLSSASLSRAAQELLHV